MSSCTIFVHTQILQSFTYHIFFRKCAAISHLLVSRGSIRGIKLSGQSVVDRSCVQFSGFQMKEKKKTKKRPNSVNHSPGEKIQTRNKKMVCSSSLGFGTACRSSPSSSGGHLGEEAAAGAAVAGPGPVADRHRTCSHHLGANLRRTRLSVTPRVNIPEKRLSR